MFRFMRDAGGNLSDKLESIRPATLLDKPTRHFQWVLMKNIPLGAWSEKFFRQTAAHFGTFVCQDDQTDARARFDMARILITTPIPMVGSRIITMKMGGEGILR